MKPLRLVMMAFGPYPDRCEIDFEALDHGLFLITGPTGAGKTTIFDAIKYALYGKLSGTGRKDAKGVRSHHAVPEAEAFVQLDFEHAGKVYRAKRVPDQERLSKHRNKEGGYDLVNVAERASLECLTDEVSLAGKSRDVTARVVELLGIDDDQFSRIVMIAQGEFAAVLNAGTEKRQEIFRRVFGTGVYLSIQDALKQRNAQIESSIDAVAGQLDTVFLRLNVTEQSRSYGRFQNLRQQGRSAYLLSDYLEMLADLAEEDEEQLLQQKEFYEREAQELSALNQRIGEARVLSQRREELQESEEWLLRNAPELEKAADLLSQQEAEEPRRVAWLQQAGRIEAALPAYDDLAALQRRLETARSEQRQTAQKRQTEAARKEKAQAVLEKAAQELEQLGNIEAQESQLAQIKQQLEVRQGLNARIASLLKSSQDAKKAFDGAAARAQKEDAAWQQASQASVRARSRYNASIAGILALELHPGEACPVCGSTDHPDLAKPASNVLSLEEVEHLEAQAEACRATAISAANEVAAAQGVLTEVRQSLLQQAQEAWDVQEESQVQGVLQEKRQLCNEQKAKLSQDEQALSGKKERARVLSESAEASRLFLEEADALLRDLESRETAQRTSCEKLAAACEERTRQLPFPAKDEALRELSKLTAQVEASRRNLEKARERLAALEKAQEGHKARRESCRKVLQDAKGCEDLASLQSQKDALENSAREASKCIADLQFRLKAYGEIRQGAQQAQEQMGSLDREHALVNRMSRIAAGEAAGAAGKIAFEAYVQGIYFDQVLSAANSRLQAMSGSRYCLLRRMTSDDARKKAGLELEVLDRNTGTCRSPQTLSGGETFLASLSLALGFSDLIQAQAGGVHIDAMFIDEGFGSLDEETCQTAIRVLSELAVDNRLVGVISHVGLLKDSVSRQLVVKKGMAGSTVSLEK